ncbi:hypothetical protein KR94_05950 [Pantoea ananatis]|nr:hypothetical protein KR94_05950 [Pantoea ananatis]
MPFSRASFATLVPSCSDFSTWTVLNARGQFGLRMRFLAIGFSSVTVTTGTGGALERAVKTLIQFLLRQGGGAKAMKARLSGS